VDDIVSQESKAERSLMHRFNIALVCFFLASASSHALTQAQNACTQSKVPIEEADGFSDFALDLLFGL